MSDLLEAFASFAADALRRRIGRSVLRVFLLEGLQLTHELVILGVRNFRPVENVVEVFVISE
jgi:hypothetical protein